MPKTPARLRAHTFKAGATRTKRMAAKGGRKSTPKKKGG